MVFSLLTIVLWGVWGALTKVISADIDAYTNQVLFAIGVVPVMAIVLFSGRLSGGVNRKRGISYAFLTGVLGGTGNIAFFMAFSEGGKAAVVVPATSLSPLVTVILGYFILKERASGYQKAGLALAMVAIYLLSL
ncbi:MAG TPA: DMT family transporter [Terriglobia bacterium]|nr:DMT family transporter [Terriglobia bacterium]